MIFQYDIFECLNINNNNKTKENIEIIQSFLNEK